MISIICSTYDRPAALLRLIESLKRQTLQDWELLIMDESESYYSKPFTTKGITAVKCKRYNDWGYSVKEQGAKMAKGEYLCFPADDAQYEPTFLEKLSATGADLAYCDWNFTNQNRIVEAQPKEGYIDVGGFLLKRSLFTGFPNKGLWGDARLVEQIAKDHTAVRVPEVLYIKS